ncbi:MAG: type I methionyl aminopeptidase [Patescibacteria group bacterium]
MINIKSKEEIEIMAEGGRKISKIKDELKKLMIPGAIPADIDKRAEELILEAGGQPSFKMVPKYRWATCININDGVVHGVPTKLPFKNGDIVKLDIGIFYKGFHNDTAFSVGIGEISRKDQDFLETGQQALKNSINQAISGNRVAHISRVLEETLTKKGYAPVRDLTGHGVGKNLHEDPQIPCYWVGDEKRSPVIPEGATLAIEVIYAQGSPELVLSGDDGWTIKTQDGKIAALFEETIAITDGEPLVLSSPGFKLYD